ncbi:hypothetical protein C1H46_029288 [Malus baccata]|uniref:Uncharacterized protein n=1 Tax=Malus baccata TaxID=106549 RepID=A0A540LFG3_MALBA|nr:hypothetical protein C1H46_029288 [Malus baccata]
MGRVGFPSFFPLSLRLIVHPFHRFNLALTGDLYDHASLVKAIEQVDGNPW